MIQTTKRANARPKPHKKQPCDQEIDNILQMLFKSENVNGSHLYASGEPESIVLEQKHKNLDALARLITGNETCASVCVIANELVVSSNKGAIYARDYFPFLTNYLNRMEFKDQYDQLKLNAITQTELIVSEILNNRTDKERQEAIKKCSDSYNPQYVNLLNVLSNNPLNVQAIYELGQQIIENNNATDRERNLATNILRPIIDTNVFLSSFENGELDLRVIECIKNQNIRYLLNSRKHAEMQLFEELCLSLGEYYCGITKLACWPCNVVLLLFNTLNNLGVQIKYSGTHGGTYPNWEAPNWILNDSDTKQKFLLKLRETPGGYYKGREMYPYEGNTFPNKPILAEFNSITEIKNTLAGIAEEIKIKSATEVSLQNQLNEDKINLSKITKDLEDTNKQIQDISCARQKLESELSKLMEDTRSYDIELNTTQTNLKAFDDFLKDIQSNGDNQKLHDIRKFILERDPDLSHELGNELRKIRISSSEKVTIAIDMYQAKQSLKKPEELTRKTNAEQEITEYHSRNKELLYSETCLEEQKRLLDSQITDTTTNVNKLKQELKTLSSYKEKIELAVKEFAQIHPDELKDIINTIYGESVDVVTSTTNTRQEEQNNNLTPNTGSESECTGLPSFQSDHSDY